MSDSHGTASDVQQGRAEGQRRLLFSLLALQAFPQTLPSGLLCPRPQYYPLNCIHTSCTHGALEGRQDTSLVAALPHPARCPCPYPRQSSDAGANLGYSAMLQTLLQLQLIIHSRCQRPRRQKREGDHRNQEKSRDTPSSADSVAICLAQVSKRGPHLPHTL